MTEIGFRRQTSLYRELPWLSCYSQSSFVVGDSIEPCRDNGAMSDAVPLELTLPGLEEVLLLRLPGLDVAEGGLLPAGGVGVTLKVAGRPPSPCA